MRLALLVTALVIAPSLLAAQQRPAPCATPAHRAFDFWVGEWNVTDTAGNVIATSSIQLQANSCAIMEHWMPKGGPDGVSISWLEPTDKKWHQSWVGGGGWIAGFTGGPEGKIMVLNGDKPGQGGGMSRMKYELLADGRVSQTVESSSDGGKSWTGGPIYYKKKS